MPAAAPTMIPCLNQAHGVRSHIAGSAVANVCSTTGNGTAVSITSEAD